MPFHSMFLDILWDTLLISSLCVLVQVLDRGEKIELLVDKTETLHHQVISYYCEFLHETKSLVLYTLLVEIIVTNTVVS